MRWSTSSLPLSWWSVACRRTRRPPSDAQVDSLVSLEDGAGVRDTRMQTRVFDGCDVQTRRSGSVGVTKAQRREAE
jgi:hypothetical protein